VQAKEHQAHRAGLVFKRHQYQQPQVEQTQHAALDAEQEQPLARQWGAAMLGGKPQGHTGGDGAGDYQCDQHTAEFAEGAQQQVEHDHGSYSAEA
jgi:hypothetical protein